MRWKRPLFLIHRWAGIVLCLFFALWFSSGLFMMYVEFPQLTRSERLSGRQLLDFSTATVNPGAAVARLEAGDFDVVGTPNALLPVDMVDRGAPIDSVRSIRLSMILGRPAYVVNVDSGAQPRVVFADTGELLREVTQASGREAAMEFARRSALPVAEQSVAFDGSLHVDQWTVSGALNGHRPLLRYELNDAQGTVLYVSSRTAEVVRDTYRRERVFNYFGAVIHWVYPTFLRRYPDVWEWVVDLLSSAGVVLSVSGLWIGVLRWKFRPQPGKPSVPYRGLMRWHYFAGISFGAVTLTWVLSGLLSMNPLSVNPSPQPEQAQSLVFAGKPLTPGDFELPRRGFGADAREAEIVHYEGQPFYLVGSSDLAMQLIPAGEGAALRPSASAMMQRAPALMPGAKVASAEVLEHYDDYYYTRHPEHGDTVLPIVRIKFDDAEHTWFHLDPTSGQVIERSTRTNRIYRWLYNGLHSWDIRWLWERRPLWDICVIAFSLGGVLLSSLGVVIGVKRLRYGRRGAPGRKRASHEVMTSADLEERASSPFRRGAGV